MYTLYIFQRDDLCENFNLLILDKNYAIVTRKVSVFYEGFYGIDLQDRGLSGAYWRDSGIRHGICRTRILKMRGGDPGGYFPGVQERRKEE